MQPTPKIAFFGGEPLGPACLKALCAAGLTPSLVVCNPDRPSGRGQHLTFPPIKTWALEHDLEVFQPESYKDRTALTPLTETEWDLFVVVAYNFILPKWLLELPTHGVMNVHPSLLPKLRGVSPIRTAILEDRRDEIGVSIMLLDEEMDHGPLLAWAPLAIAEKDWPMAGPKLDTTLAELGSALLSDIVPLWLQGEITPTPQDHHAATYTKKFLKQDAELILDPHHLPTGAEAYQALLKIHAFAGIADCFFIHEGKRIKIKAAGRTTGGQLELLRVIPEGKSEIEFSEYLRHL